ncbi:putative Malectin-like domain-containing protein [Arabidopsis thaliana]
MISIHSGDMESPHGVLLLAFISTLAIVHLVQAQDQKGISIDCGTTGSYVDSNNVTWVGDNGFVTTGESINITDVTTKPINTLRYFPTGQTNCYTNIPVTKGRKTLVRTKYYYENYDDKFSPPSFDIVYDGKHRDSIDITESLLDDEDTFYFSEVIFAPASENISVCLLRTSPSDNPFISSIEVYSFDDGMYKDLGPEEGLILYQRITYGAKKLISYPLDPFGRLWSPSASGDNTALTDLSTSAPSIDITGASNKPPEIVMSKALSGDGLIISDLPLPSTATLVYLALYFSEPQSLGRTQKRSFNVFLDDMQVGSHPIVPVFGKATQLVLRDVEATSGSQIVLKSTDDSVLPTMINGLELYSISNNQHGGSGGKSGGGDNGGGGGQSGGGNNGGTNLKGGKKKSSLPLILGVTFASVFVLLWSAFVVNILRKRQNAKPVSNTAPTTSTERGIGTGTSPLFGQEMASDTNDSYVVQNEQH